jgi:hypothetical protein
MSGPNLHEFLTAVPAVAAVVGDRVYPDIIPQHVYDEVTRSPCIVYQRLGATRSATYCGHDLLVAAAIQVDHYAQDFDAAVQLGDLTRQALRDYSGTMGTVRVRWCRLDSETHLVEPEPGLFRLSADWTIWYVEA